MSGSNFEIDADANLKVDGASPAIDWLAGGSGTAMRSGVLVKDDRPTGQNDDSFTQGTDINSPPNATITTGSIPNNKSDLTHFGIYKEEGGSDPFINVFWTRVQAPSGTTTMDFEFNQSPLRSNGISPPNNPDVNTTTIPVRTKGDILLSYLLDNGGTNPTLTKRIWSGSAWGVASTPSAGDGLASINTSAIPAAAAGGLGALDPLTFGEASIRLSSFASGEDTCTTFGSVYLRSRSSATDTDENKDFIAPEPITISNCGSVKIHKTDDNGALAGAEFTLYKNVAPTTAPRGTGDVATTLTCTTDASGDCTIINVPKGDYWAVETSTPAGHDTAADQPVSITAGDQQVPLTFNDPIQKGTITVIKDAVPNDAQPFTFSLTGQAGFTLSDGGAQPNTKDFTVPVGTYSLSETNIPDGWVNTNLVCDDANGSVAKPTATIHLDNGEHVTCTYTDTFTKLDVNLQTQTAVAQANTSWNDSASLTGDGVHPVTGNVTFFACAAAATATACSTGGTQVGTAATVVHDSGAAYSASTTAPYTPTDAGWTCFRAVFVSTSDFYAGSDHTNAGSECFVKQAQDLTVTKTATAAFGRHYTWTIDKSVDHGTISIPSGGTATSHYTVTVGNSHVDSAWTVTGNVTVHNPNPVAFTGVGVTDAIDNGAGNCAVAGGTSATVPSVNDPTTHGDLVLPYACTYANAPSPTAGTNTATATWNKATFFTPDSSASGTAHVDFANVVPSVSDAIVTVTDTVQGVLGTLDARTAANPTVFTYTVDRSGVPGACTPYDNTASYLTNDSKTTGSSSKTVTVCVGVDLQPGVTAVGSKSRNDLWLISKSADKTTVDIANGGTATFNYQVTATPNGFVDSAYLLDGVVTATNPNNWEAITATLTVATNVGGGASCAVTDGVGKSIAAGGSISRAYHCTFSGAPASGTVTATVNWNGATAFTPHSSATATAAASFPIGTESNSTVHVVDDKTNPGSPVDLGTATFSNGPTTFNYSLTKQGVGGQCTDYTNTATISETGQTATKTVTVCVGLDLTVTKSAVTTDHRTFLWGITKDVDQTTRNITGGNATFNYSVTVTPSGTTDDGWTVAGQITVTNPNKWEAITADITDVVDSGGGANCLVGNGTDVTIAKDSQLVLNYQCTFTSKPSDGTNTATATWDSESASTPHGSATGTAPVVFIPTSKTNETITVVDDKTNPDNPVTLGTATYGDGPKTFTYSVDLPGTAGECNDFTNTAVISETEQSADKTVTVCQGEALTATATASGTFDRTYLWSIDKAVDRTTVTAAQGTKVTYNYTVTATPGATSDSGYKLGGTVTISNPNQWEDVTADVTVTTDLAPDAVCTVTNGTDRSVAADGDLTLPFTCAFTTAPAKAGNVTADVTWDAEAASTPVATAAVTIPATLELAGETDKTVNVTDDKTDPANPVALGTATWGTDPTVFTYPLVKTAAGTTCTTYTNTAVIVETEQNATQDVQLCSTFTGGGGKVVVPPVTGGGGLPFTGDFSGLLSRWALGMILAGGMLLLSSRRRRRV